MQVQPWYRTIHWGTWLVLFITSWVNYFANGGTFPSTHEGWATFVGTVILWLVAAYNTVSGATRAAEPIKPNGFK